LSIQPQNFSSWKKISYCARLPPRLRWNHRPESDFFIIYTAGQRFASLETNAPQYYQNSLTIKATYSWRP
jgi:hypothetical protein